jgi:hypothetical protein
MLINGCCISITCIPRELHFEILSESRRMQCRSMLYKKTKKSITCGIKHHVLVFLVSCI